MKTHAPLKFNKPRYSWRDPNRVCERTGFTLIEVVLVLVVIVIISGISLPYFAGTHRGTKLRTASRTIDRMSRYARSMAILREETLTMALNHETMELYLGGSSQTDTNKADGELDQEVLGRLGYIDKDATADTPKIEKDVHRFLPDGLTVRSFDMNEEQEGAEYENFYLINFYPDGRCDGFRLVLEDSRGMAVTLENDPVSGKIHIEFSQ